MKNKEKKEKRPENIIEFVDKLLTTHDVKVSKSGMFFTPKKKELTKQNNTYDT